MHGEAEEWLVPIVGAALSCRLRLQDGAGPVLQGYRWLRSAPRLGYRRRDPSANERVEDSAFRQDKVLSPENRRVGDRLGRHGDLAWRSVLLDRGRSALPSPEIPASVVHRQALPAGRSRHALGLPEAFGSAGSAARQRFRGSLLPAIAQSKDSAESRATAAKEQAQRRGAERELNVWDRSEEHTSELQSHSDLVCRLLLEKK